MSRRTLAWLAAYVAAMAFLEAAVVVYLRELYYPAGFRFPIVLIPDRLAVVEVGREAATVVMLAAAAALAGSGGRDRFLLFCASFGAWDILFYAWLKVLLGWPSSLLEWDLLFLIPVPWIGPVLAPLLVSAGMIGGAAWLLALGSRGAPPRIPAAAWALAVAGGLTVILSFTIDGGVVLSGAMPPPFRWGTFAAGMAAGIAGLVLAARRPGSGRA